MTRKRKPAPSAPAMLPLLEDPLDGLGWGLKIHRYVEPRDWPRELDKVPAEHRAEAEAYLRGIATRMRAQRRMKGDG